MKATIRGLSTATPCHQMTQAEATELFSNVVCTEEKQRRLARALFRKSGVERRHTVVPHRAAYHWCAMKEQAVAAESSPVDGPGSFEVQDYLEPTDQDAIIQSGGSAGPTTEERMALYAQFAPDLACDAARGAFEGADISTDAITHLVTVSCTGFGAPGVDIELIDRLHLPRTTQRINVGFMGCHGGINGLRAAKAIVESETSAKVLLCATELCSLHYRFQWDSEGIIGNALFADGAAAMILEAGNPTQADSSWQVVKTGSVLVKDSKEAMSWTVGDYGFEMLLTSEVGDHIEQALQPWLQDWLGAQGLSIENVDRWAVHPGGPRILSAVEKGLSLPSDALDTSREVLRNHGNMSSPTVMFILQAFERMEIEKAEEHCLVLGFGPGLMAEVALLKRCRE